MKLAQHLVQALKQQVRAARPPKAVAQAIAPKASQAGKDLLRRQAPAAIARKASLAQAAAPSPKASAIRGLLPAAKAPVALLPAAKPPSGLGGLFPAAQQAGWARHQQAVAAAYEAGTRRHNASLDGLQAWVSRQADGPAGHRVAAVLSDGARWGEKGFQVAAKGAKFVQDLLEKRPKVEDIQKAFQAVKEDPNAFRAWVKTLPGLLPRF